MSDIKAPVVRMEEKKAPSSSGSISHDVEKHGDGVVADSGVLTDGIEHADGRLEAHATDSAYARKVYLVNRVMNERIGMGKFQWQLFLLSGLGWLLDNLWLQGVAIILPQVVKEFGDSRYQWMTFSLYIGLILGASIWGILADVIGRRLSFNATLFLAGVFGVAGGAAPSFVGLAGLLAALGVGLGGNLPVDGMLFLEFIPGSSQYLLTLLSIFWSLGQLIASLIAWAFIANFSCSSTQTNVAKDLAENPTWTTCDPALNMGWRYSFYTFGAITLFSFFMRYVVFKLPESPKYLLAKGRDAAAVQVLREIARRNGTELGEDVINVAMLRRAAGENIEDIDEVEEKDEGMLKTMMRGVSLDMIKPDLSHVRPLFSGGKLAWNTSVIFLLWGLIGLAYPLYNAFLPIYLTRTYGSGAAPTVNETYRNYAIISVCGIPGSAAAALLVELKSAPLNFTGRLARLNFAGNFAGRRLAMFLGTLLTAVFLFAFTAARNEAQVLAFNCITALTQNIMYGVLYGYTPEVFPAPHRGTGDAIASSINRIFGLMAPIVSLFSTSTAPVYASASLFLVSALLMLTLQIESQGKTAL